MKRKSLQFFTMAMLLSVSAVIVSAGSFGAASSSNFRVDVPFDFRVGKKTFPAGEYYVKRVRTRSGQGQVIIENLESGKQKYIFGTLAAVPWVKSYTGFTLSFNRYGDIHFLRQIVSPDAEFSLSQSKAEKRIRKKGRIEPSKMVVLGK